MLFCKVTAPVVSGANVTAPVSWLPVLLRLMAAPPAVVEN
jgi:hypothetical protein